jgi:hypothetical protein
MKLGAGASADVSMGANGSGGGAIELFNLSSPAGWAMFWWGLSALIILAMLISL